MKRALSILLLVVLVVGMIVPTMASAMANPFTRYVKTGNGKSLNGRSGPGRNFSVEGTIPYGTSVQVIETKGNWCLVDPGLKHWSNPLWVQKNFLVTKYPGKYKPTPKPENHDSDIDAVLRELTKINTPYLAEIVTKRPNNYVHLRWVPKTNARYSAKYLAGEQIMVLSESKHWALAIDLNDGNVGYVQLANVNPVKEITEEDMAELKTMFTDFSATLADEIDDEAAAQ